MISDVLSEAVDEIDRYLRDFPRAYQGEILDEILEVRTVMDRLRIKLDTPPAL